MLKDITPRAIIIKKILEAEAITRDMEEKQVFTYFHVLGSKTKLL